MGLPGLRVQGAADAIQELEQRTRAQEELRRQQAQFAQIRRELDLRNSWMAIPALAPAAAVLGVEAAAALAAGVTPALSAGALVLTKKMPYLRVGDFWGTRGGRLAHRDLAVRVRSKPGWKSEETIRTESGVVRPDVTGPVRHWKPDKPGMRFQMELKPNTPSGRRAAAKAVEKYEKATGRKTRAIFYDPKDFM